MKSSSRKLLQDFTLITIRISVTSKALKEAEETVFRVSFVVLYLL